MVWACHTFTDETRPSCGYNDCQNKTLAEAMLVDTFWWDTLDECCNSVECHCAIIDKGEGGDCRECHGQDCQLFCSNYLPYPPYTGGQPYLWRLSVACPFIPYPCFCPGGTSDAFGGTFVHQGDSCDDAFGTAYDTDAEGTCQEFEFLPEDRCYVPACGKTTTTLAP
jgi:hypothetical protein